MRSSDLAGLAGVTVRTLRHYHQIGLLEEPERSSSGYRVYDTHTLVKVLRIRRLVGLGFSLPQIATMLDGDEPPPAEVFDALDAEFAAEIDRISRQREVLALLRQHEAFPDLPPELAQFHQALRESGLPANAAALDRDHTLLLANMLGSDGQGHLTAIYELISHPQRADQAAAAMTAWANLDDESTPEEIADVAERFTQVFLPIMAELESKDLPDVSGALGTWYQQQAADYITPAQVAALEQLRASLEGAAQID